MSRLRLLIVLVLMPFAFTATAAAEDAYDCGLLTAEGCGESSGTNATGPAAASCRIGVEGVFWTGTDWERLARALASDRPSCGEYWVSIPPLAANKKGLRILQDDVIRGLGIHPVAEFTIGEDTGWANWVLEPGKGRTWFQAGVEFRRALVAAGYRGPDETWLLNEFDRTTMLDAPRGTFPADHRWPAFRRADLVQLLQGLYFGDVGMPLLPGVVEIGIHHRHQNIPNVAEYKEQVKAWLRDDAFWRRVSPAIRWLAVEAYPDVRNWGVPGSSRNDRRRHLEDYIFHLLELVRDGPPEAAAARELFERAYLPLVNAGYRARGGDEFAFRTGHGNTIVDAATMQHFVSEQTYAIRHYAGTHPQGAPGGRIGFSWQPCNRVSAGQEACDPVALRGFVGELDILTARIAQSIQYAYRQGGASPVGACSPPGSGVDWCAGELPGASFTDVWRIFGLWD